MRPPPVGLAAVSNDGSRPRRGNQKPNDRRASRPGNTPGRGGAPKGRSQGGKPGRSQGQGRSTGPRRDDDRRPQRGGTRRNDRDERGSRGERRPDRDLAGPQQWGRIARRGAGNMEYEDPETIAQREEYKQRKAERARREAERAAETPEKPTRPQRERDLPAASDLQRQASRAVSRGRKGAPARDRRRLPARPHPVKDPAVALKKLVGEPRSKTLVRRLHEGAKAFEAERFADARTARVIVLEEDLEIAPDFFGFFAAVAPVVDGDASILAASAWNDNGQRRHVDVTKDIARVERSDFFGGLGWMLARRVWEELAPKWPDAYWDDWLREPEQRRNRHVVRPVVCRTFHVKSTRGTSGGQYSHFLSDIVLSQSAETVFDVDDVRSSAAADARLFAKLEAAPRVDLGEVLAGSARGTVRVEYDGSFAAYAALARRLGAMDNEKAGVPRGAYRGVVELRRGPVSVLLSPPLDRVRALAAGAAYARP